MTRRTTGNFPLVGHTFHTGMGVSADPLTVPANATYHLVLMEKMEEHGMNRSIKSAWLLASLASLVAVLVLQASPAAAKTSYNFGFEKGPKPFTDGSTGPA